MSNPYDLPIVSPASAASSSNPYNLPTPHNNVQEFPLLQDYGTLKPPAPSTIDFSQVNMKPPPSNLPIGIIPTLKPILHAVMPELVNANDAVVAAIAERTMKPLSDFWNGYKERTGLNKPHDPNLGMPLPTDSPEVAKEKQQHILDLVMGFVNPYENEAVNIAKIAKSTSVREIGDTIRQSFPFLKHAADGLAEHLALINDPNEVATFLRTANEEAFKLHVVDAAHGVSEGLAHEAVPVHEGPTLEDVQTKPELFQQTRSLEKTAGGGGFEPYKVSEIGKNFNETRLLNNPISVGLFDEGHVVTSGHNRLQILREAKAKGLLTKPDSHYMNITDYRGQGGLQSAIDESIASNVASKSIKDINLLDLYIRGSIDESALKNALSYDEKKIKFFAQVADTFKQNGLVSMWKDSVGQKLADLKSLDFGAMSERLNFVNGIAKKTGAAIRDLSVEQKVAVQGQVGKLIQQYMSTSKRTTLAAVESNVSRVLDTIRSGGFKNEQLTNLFGDIVTQTEVAKKVPVQAFQKLLADNLKSAVLPEATRGRLVELQRMANDPHSMFANMVNIEGDLKSASKKNLGILQEMMSLPDDEFAMVAGTTKVSGETGAAAQKLVDDAKAYQHQFTEGVQDIGRTVGHDVEVGPVKGSSRIAQKATTDYKGDIGKVRDANRALVFINDESEIGPIINAVKKKFGPLSRAIKTTFDKPAGAYKSIILNIKTPLGHEAEIQLTTPEMWKASKEQGGHQLYEQVRSKLGQWERAEADMEALYARAEEEGKYNSATRGEKVASSALHADSEIRVPRSDALSGEYGKPDARATPHTSVPSESTATGAPSTSKYLGNDSSAIPDQYSAQSATPQEGVDRGFEQGVMGQDKRVSVGDGTRLPYEKPQKRPIHDTIPLPPSIGEIMTKNGMVPIEQTPAHTLEEIATGQDGKSWTSIVKGYMYNHVKGKKATIIDYYATPEFVLEKLGLGKAAELLQNAKDVYRTTLKKEFTKIDEWMARVGTGQSHIYEGKTMQHTKEDSSRLIFQWLDGQEKEITPFMSTAEREVATEIRAYLKEWADRLHLPEENRIGKYITHIWERDAENKGMSEFDDPELASIMNKQVAGSVYDPFLQKRMGAQEYVQDAFRALDAYVKRASRKEAMDPALDRLVEDAKQLDDYTYDYVKEMSHRINMRPTSLEKGMDNFIRQTWVGDRFTERPTAFLSKKVRGMFYRGTLGLNISSALRNIGQGANTYAKLGEKYTTIGYGKLLYKMASRDLQELFETGILDDGFVQDRAFGATRKNLQKMDNTLYGLFSFAEKINRGSAYYGAKAKAIGQGLSEEEAVTYAKRMVRETQFAFGAVDTPVGLNDDVIKTLAQLQTYNIKQTEFLGRMMKQKDLAGLIRWTAATLGYMYSIGSLFGMTASQILPTIGLGGAPTTSTLLAIPGLFSSDAQVKAKAQSQLQRNISTMIPAGAQIRKTAQGAEAYAAGKDVTKTGRLRYRIDQDPATLVRALLFGKSALPQAQAYYDKLDQPKKSGGGSNPYSI